MQLALLPSKQMIPRPNHSIRAGWFRWDKIHPLERRGVPEFFTRAAIEASAVAGTTAPTTAAGKTPGNQPKSLRSPALYKEYRDAMLLMYCQLKATDPPLTFTQVSTCGLRHLKCHADNERARLQNRGCPPGTVFAVSTSRLRQIAGFRVRSLACIIIRCFFPDPCISKSA